MHVDAFRKQANAEVKLQHHRTIEVGDATLECILCGSGVPVVLLANAGCSTGYFDDLARMLSTLRDGTKTRFPACDILAMWAGLIAAKRSYRKVVE
jgi:hypothetical protein